jgi:hypothetical protein
MKLNLPHERRNILTNLYLDLVSKQNMISLPKYFFFFCRIYKARKAADTKTKSIDILGCKKLLEITPFFFKEGNVIICITHIIFEGY